MKRTYPNLSENPLVYLSGNQLKVYLFIGLNNGQEISRSEFVNELALDPSVASKTISSLLEKDLIRREKQANNRYLYSLEKTYPHVNKGGDKTSTLIGDKTSTLIGDKISPRDKISPPKVRKSHPQTSRNLTPLTYIKELLSLAKLSSSKSFKNQTPANEVFEAIHPVAAKLCLYELERSRTSPQWALERWGEDGLKALLLEAQKTLEMMDAQQGNRLGFIWADFILSRGRFAPHIQPLRMNINSQTASQPNPVLELDRSQVWQDFYDRGMDEGMSDDHAVSYADQMLAKTLQETRGAN